MDEDAMMRDQAMATAMDIDGSVPPVHPPTNSASAATNKPRNSFLARRNVSNAKELRSKFRKTLMIHPSAKVQKSSSSTSKTLFRRVHNTNEEERRNRAIRRNLRKQQVTRAIANGSFQITHNNTDDLASQRGDGSTVTPGADDHMRQEQAEQLRRLDEHLVAAALFEPIPGMTFDPAAPCAFTSDPAAMADLVQALEAFQRHLARKGRVVLSDKAGGLLRGFARDVLGTVLTLLLPPQQRPDWTVMMPGMCGAAGGAGAGAGAAGGGGVEDEFWAGVAREYEASKKLKWLYFRVMWADPAGKLMVGKTASLWDYVKMVLEAVECPGTHPDIIEVLGPVINGMPPFIAALPSTLQALMSHFETARARYLATLKTTDTKPTVSNLTLQQKTLATGLGRLPRGGDDQYDSSEDEDDGPRGGMFDGGPEDDGQVAEGVPSDLGQWFLMKLDRFTAFKTGEQQGAVDGDMLSTLDLGAVTSNL